MQATEGRPEGGHCWPLPTGCVDLDGDMHMVTFVTLAWFMLDVELMLACLTLPRASLHMTAW